MQMCLSKTKKNFEKEKKGHLVQNGFQKPGNKSEGLRVCAGAAGTPQGSGDICLWAEQDGGRS